MIYTLGPEIWAAATIGAGVCGYLIGEIRGASRRFAAEDLASEEFEGLFAFHIPRKVKGEKRDIVEAAQAGTKVDRHASSLSSDLTPVATNEHSYPSSLTNMPSIGELRAQIEEIRAKDNVWADPESSDHLLGIVSKPTSQSGGMVEKYRQAIQELRRANAEQRNLFVPLSKTDQGAIAHEPIYAALSDPSEERELLQDPKNKERGGLVPPRSQSAC